MSRLDGLAELASNAVRGALFSRLHGPTRHVLSPLERCTLHASVLQLPTKPRQWQSHCFCGWRFLARPFRAPATVIRCAPGAMSRAVVSRRRASRARQPRSSS